jgi:predicted transcriptional regulator
MTLDLSDEVDQKLTDIAKQNGITKAEAMRRAFACWWSLTTRIRSPASRWASSANVTTTRRGQCLAG